MFFGKGKHYRRGWFVKGGVLAGIFQHFLKNKGNPAQKKKFILLLVCGAVCVFFPYFSTGPAD